MAQYVPYQALKETPKEIHRAATVALVCSSFTRALGILFSTVIIATLPTWVPDLLTYQPIPIALLVLTIGCIIVAGKGSRIREEIVSRQYEKARGSSLSAAILGFTFAGVIPGILYILLYMKIGNVMVKRRPDEPRTMFLLPHPSEGLFLGRYMGWGVAYLFVLYIGYTQLPIGLRSVSDWLSPILGVHFNTLIVATYLIFTNPLTYPPVLQLWITAGLLGGIIAGGRVGRGFMVGLAVFLSTLGAMGLAALNIFRGISSGNIPGIPPAPAGFALISAATGPVASDLLPLFLQTSSPTDPAFLQSVILTLARNAGLIFAIVTISGRVACLGWQGGIDLVKFVFVAIKGKPKLTTNQTIVDRPSLKTAIILLMLLPFLTVPHAPSHANYQAPISGKYGQQLAIGLDMIGAPNVTLEMTGLDLSSQSIVVDNNYVGATVAAFIVNNDDSQPFGNSQQAQGQFLQAISQPALVTYFNGGSRATASQSGAIEAQFSRAFGTPFTTIFSLPAGQGGSATIYAPNPELSNYDALTKILGLLPNQSFATLINPSNIQNMKYFAALGIVPITINGVNITGLSFYMHIQYPRQFYKGGTHQLDLKTLLGFQSNIVGDPVANVSLVSVHFQPGTVLYSPQNSLQEYYVKATSTFYLNATAGPQSDLITKFAYPFAPDIVIQKSITPTVGPVGTTHAVIVTIQNLDNVTVMNASASDPEATPQYLQTLQISPSGTQTAQSPVLAPRNNLTMSYTVTTGSSGIYVLSPSTVTFAWTAPNGTKITYSVGTDPEQFDSVSGPWIQFTRTFNEFQPYSYLLLVPLLLTPVIETYRLFRRRAQRRREKELTAASNQPPAPSSDLPKTPEPSAGSSNPPPS